MNLEYNINELNQQLANLNKANEKLKQDFEQEKNKNTRLIQENSDIIQKNKELTEKNKPFINKNLNSNNVNNKDEDISNKLKKKEEELEALNTFIFKLQKELEKEKEDNEAYELKINSLKKENNSIRKQLERLTETMPKELNALKMQLDEANRRNQKIMAENNINNINNNNINNINTNQKSQSLINSDRNKKNIKNKNKTLDSQEIQPEKYNNILSKLNDANKEISKLKNKNKELQFQLEEKEVKSAFSGFRTEDANLSNYEEEFDLRKMANGARDKNRSEDINIDYPGIQGVKEKLKELEFRYNSLVEQIKILIGNIPFNQKIKPQIVQICQLIGYSPKTTGRIITSAKEKKKILGI